MQARRIELFRFDTAPMRAFHMSWSAFFLCFFAWFGIAPLMPVVRAELSLSAEQVGWTMIGSVAITILARLVVGRMCDRYGPRLTFTWLLALGSLPVMGIALADRFETFLLLRVLVGMIGASFVVTQYHTSLMFASNCVGTANATTAGWGNLGGGVAQMVMPLLFALLVGTFGLSTAAGWRVAMILAGLLCLAAAVAYYKLTQDTPRGNFSQVSKASAASASRTRGASWWAVCRDVRVWTLAALYGACFGIELTINNLAALYFVDYFGLSITAAGMAAAAFGLMNLFARTLGGTVGDRCGIAWGLRGRAAWLFMAVFCEGLALMLFSQVSGLGMAIATLVLFSLMVQMAEGATFAVVPLVRRDAIGTVSGIVGAGGNVGAVAAGFVLKAQAHWPTALLILGAAVTAISMLALVVRFAAAEEPEFALVEAETSAADDEPLPVGIDPAVP